MEKEDLYKINELTAEFYNQQLYKYENGYQYLEQRKIGDDAKNKFKIGYAPSHECLYFYLKSKGYDDKVLGESNLFVKIYDYYYDRFSDRIILPIKNEQNRIVGFDARALYEALPKYMNMPEGEHFKKRENLYGINVAKNTHEDFFIIVEGYFDVITLHDAGVNNVVGIMGTNLTEQQAKLIKKYTDKVVIAFDSDKAGKDATIKAILTLQKFNVKCKVIQLDCAKDPEEYVKKYGIEKFKILLNTTINSEEFKEQLELTNNIEYIKQNIDIIPIISQYVKLDFISQVKNISFEKAIEYLIKGQANCKNVYHLQVEAYSRRYGELQEKYGSKSGVYSTIEIAVEKGKQWLSERLEELHKNMDIEGSIQELIDWHAIYYKFKVTELEPEYADNYILPAHRYECEDEVPTHTEYYYNLKGELINKNVEYRNCKDDESYIVNVYSRKEKIKTNRFEIGDFVTVTDDYEIPPDRVFVIRDIEDVIEHKGFSEYRYNLATDIYDKERDAHYLENIYEYSERQLNKFEGEIASDSPIAIMSKVYKNAFEISPETEKRLFGESG